jgi:hypothetical protein
MTTRFLELGCSPVGVVIVIISRAGAVSSPLDTASPFYDLVGMLKIGVM